MPKIITILMLLHFFSLVHANDDDLFSDNNFEIDKDFIDDDFAAMEQGAKLTSESFLSEPYELFSQHGVVRTERSFGATFGGETIARVFHLTLMPQARFKVWRVQNHLGLPLRFPVYDNIRKKNATVRKKGFVTAEEFITPRLEDFRSFRDIQRLVRHVSLQSKKDSFSLLLAREQALTLGHGDLMREMTSDGLYDQDYLFASGHATFDPVRIDAVVGPLPSIAMLGLDVRFLPFLSLMAHPFVKNSNVDLAYIGDYRAPNEVYSEGEAFVLDKERRLLKRHEGISQGLSLGIASEFYPVGFFGSKPYATYSHLFLSDVSKNEDVDWRYGASLNLGHDATLYPVPQNKRHSLFLRSEARLFSRHYQPNYFGGMYMLDRVNISEQGPLMTKSQNAAFQENKGLRFGHLLELGYAYEEDFNVKIGYENARSLDDGKSIQPLRKLHFNTGLSTFDAAKFHLGYEVASIAQLGDLFDFEKSRALLSLRGQIKLMQFLYFDTWLKHSFGINEKYKLAAKNGGVEPVWVSKRGETRSLNFGLGLELAMVF